MAGAGPCISLQPESRIEGDSSKRKPNPCAISFPPSPTVVTSCHTPSLGHCSRLAFLEVVPCIDCNCAAYLVLPFIGSSFVKPSEPHREMADPEVRINPDADDNADVEMQGDDDVVEVGQSATDPADGGGAEAAVEDDSNRSARVTFVE